MDHLLITFNRNPLLKHLIYWVVFVLFWGFIWGLSDYGFLRNILIQMNCLPARMLLVYMSLYILIPKYFMKKRYLEFFVSYCLLVLLISIIIQRPLMLFYVQPTYIPSWSSNNFFGSSEIINTALDINIAAILPLSYQFLQALETLGENNSKLEKENADIRDSKELLYIDLKIDKSIHKIALKDIIYIESQRNNIRIKMEDRELIARQNLSLIQEMLPEISFTRIHRSYIINMEKISSFSHSKIDICNETIPIGRMYRDKIKKILG